VKALLIHLDRAEEHIACFLFFVLHCLLTITIVMRFGFSTGASWMEEIARVIFVWVVMLGAAAAMRRGSHIRLGFGLQLLPVKARPAAALLGNLLLLAFCLATAWYGTKLVLSLLRIPYILPSSGMSMFWAYLSVPVSFSLQGLRVIQNQFGRTVQ